MVKKTSLCSVLLKEILSTHSSITQFSKISGLSRSTFSLIFRKEEPKPVSFEQLVKITLALGYSEEHFFALYIEEYFNKEKFNKSRIKKALNRCGELGLLDYLNQMLERLSEQPYYIPVVFEAAEKLNENNLKDAALLLYNWIITSNADIPNSIAATCHYRTFRLGISMDSNHNIQLLYRFVPHRLHLPIHLKLDALIHIALILYNQQSYKELDFFADELISTCTDLFGNEKSRNIKNIAFYKILTERHPVVYYGQAYLVKQVVLEGQKKYKEAQFYCQKYGELQWFQDGSLIAQKEIDKFLIFFKVNMWNLELLQGNSNVLPEYTAFLKDHPVELIPSLITILDAANTFNFSIDALLEIFEDRLDTLFEDTESYYSEVAKRNNLSYLLYHLAIYHFNAGRVQKSLDTAIKCWDMSQTINNQQHLRLLASLTALYNMCSDSVYTS